MKLVREMVHGTRLYIGTICWYGIKTIFEVFYKYHFKAEKFTVRMYKSDQPYAIFELVWRDFEVYLKDMHTLELLRKAKKKILKKKWKKLGYGGLENPTWGDAVRLLLETRIKLLNEGEEVNPLSRVVDIARCENVKQKTIEEAKEKQIDEHGNEVENDENDDDDEEDDDFDLDDLDVDEFGNFVERETFNDQKHFDNKVLQSKFIFRSADISDGSVLRICEHQTIKRMMKTHRIAMKIAMKIAQTAVVVLNGRKKAIKLELRRRRRRKWMLLIILK